MGQKSMPPPIASQLEVRLDFILATNYKCSASSKYSRLSLSEHAGQALRTAHNLPASCCSHHASHF